MSSSLWTAPAIAALRRCACINGHLASFNAKSRIFCSRQCRSVLLWVKLMMTVISRNHLLICLKTWLTCPLFLLASSVISYTCLGSLYPLLLLLLPVLLLQAIPLLPLLLPLPLPLPVFLLLPLPVLLPLLLLLLTLLPLLLLLFLLLLLPPPLLLLLLKRRRG